MIWRGKDNNAERELRHKPVLLHSTSGVFTVEKNMDSGVPTAAVAH